MLTTPRLIAALAAAVMFAIAGCGDDDDDGGGGDAEKATQAKASGDVTWCIGKDTTGAFGTVIDNFNKADRTRTSSCSSCPRTRASSAGFRSSASRPSPPSATCSART